MKTPMACAVISLHWKEKARERVVVVQSKARGRRPQRQFCLFFLKVCFCVSSSSTLFWRRRNRWTKKGFAWLDFLCCPTQTAGVRRAHVQAWRLFFKSKQTAFAMFPVCFLYCGLRQRKLHGVLVSLFSPNFWRKSFALALLLCLFVCVVLPTKRESDGEDDVFPKTTATRHTLAARTFTAFFSSSPNPKPKQTLQLFLQLFFSSLFLFLLSPLLFVVCEVCCEPEGLARWHRSLASFSNQPLPQQTATADNDAESPCCLRPRGSSNC